MSKSVVCIFAHPDDEAFGPAGTIYKLSKEYDVYILCATKGEAGKNSASSKRKLSNIRAKELKKSAGILGVKKVYFLGFVDGCLCNSQYHELARKIEKHLKRIKPEIILTFEEGGVSGHIDHITVSRVTTYVFNKLSFIKQLWYFCLEEKYAQKVLAHYFIHPSRGIKREDAHKITDVSDVFETVKKAMSMHESQKHDSARVLNIKKDFPKEELFILLEK